LLIARHLTPRTALRTRALALVQARRAVWARRSKLFMDCSQRRAA